MFGNGNVPFNPAQVDFSALAQLPEIYRQSQLRQIQAFDGNGNPNYQAIWQYSPQTALEAYKTAQGANSAFGNIVYSMGSDGKIHAGVTDRQGNFRELDTGGQVLPPVKPTNLGDRERFVGPGGISILNGEAGGPDVSKTGPLPQGYGPQGGGGQAVAPGQPITQSGIPGTPESVSQPSVGKGNVSSIAGEVAQDYVDLYNKGGIGAPGDSALANAEKYVANSPIGQTAGRIAGTEAQGIRNKIATNRPLLIAQVKNAAGLGSRQLDSNSELQFYIQSVSDPANNDVVANITALGVLNKIYGLGYDMDSIVQGLPEKVRNQVKTRYDSAAARITKQSGPAYSTGGPEQAAPPTNPAAKATPEESAALKAAQKDLADGLPRERVIELLGKLGISEQRLKELGAE